ncbi:hypothetical protein D7V67_15475 [Clostridium paraputrificum]|uniref:hypothetical protein n=1 Tax=Clostridium paraputrificum TaxID=29363 RepID=UPI000EA363FE|nr:hypothetical protein [Clostridium paraputrificum]RKI45765.1 hypothetical protein D7V67_15475 [Clostridium paraputrificum]
MKITTQQCISILKLINAMGIKKDLIDGIKKILGLKNDSDLLTISIAEKLGDKAEDINEVARFLIDNPKIREEKNRLEEEQQGCLFEIVYLIIEGIPRAEDLFYKTIADIKGLDVEVVKGTDGAETVEIIKEIINSETFMGFFKLTMK